MRLFKKTSIAIRRLQSRAVSLLAAFLATPVLADLPKLEDPTRGKGKGIYETARNYLYDAAVLGGLIIAAVVLYVVATAAISTYRDVGQKKATWGEFGFQVVIGVILIVVIIWLMTKAAEIL